MDPDAVDDAETEHDHEHKRAGVLALGGLQAFGPT